MRFEKRVFCLTVAVALVGSGPVWAQLIYTRSLLGGDRTRQIQSAMDDLVKAQALPETDPTEKVSAVRSALLILAGAFTSAEGLSKTATGNITPEKIHDRINDILKHYSQPSIQEYAGEVLGVLAAQNATPPARRVQLEDQLFKLIGPPNQHGAKFSRVMSWFDVLADMARVGHLSESGQKKVIDYLKKTRNENLKIQAIGVLAAAKTPSDAIRDALIDAVNGKTSAWDAIRALGRYSDTNTLAKLFAVLKNGDNYYSRELAIVSLLGGEKSGGGYKRWEAMNNPRIHDAIYDVAKKESKDADVTRAKAIKALYGESQARVADSTASDGTTRHK
jgi:hypothetical protein